MKYFCFQAFFLLLSTAVIAQNHFYRYSSVDSNYFSLHDSLYNFFEANDSLKDTRWSGYKDFLRWDAQVSGRIDSNGSLNSYIQAYITAYTNLTSSTTASSSSECGGPTPPNWCGTNFLANWKPFGYTNRPKPNPSAPGNLEDDYQNGTGWMSAIWIDPNNTDHMLAGANSSGLWKTTDGGLSWESISDNLFDGIGINYIEVDPSNSNVIYVAPSLGSIKGLGIWKSTNGGVSWAQLDLSPTAINELIYKIVVYPQSTNILFAISDNKILKSTNSGSSWSAISNVSGTNLANLRDIEVHQIQVGGLPVDRILVAGNEFYISADNGITYSISTLNHTLSNSTYTLSKIQNAQLAVSSYFPNTLYRHYEAIENIPAGGGQYRFKVIQKSIDGGVNWTTRFTEDLQNITSPCNLRPGGKCAITLQERKYCFEISTLDQNLLYFGGVQIGLYRDNTTPTSLEYKNIGSTFILHDDVRAAKVIRVGNSDLLVAANDGGIAKTFYDGISSSWDWQDISNGLMVQQIYGISKSKGLPTSFITGHQDLANTYFSGTDRKWYHMNYSSGDAGMGIFNPNDETQGIYWKNNKLQRGLIDQGSGTPFPKGVTFSVGTYGGPFIYKEKTKNIYIYGTKLVGGASNLAKLNYGIDFLGTANDQLVNPTTNQWEPSLNITNSTINSNYPLSTLSVSDTEDTIFVCLYDEQTSQEKFYRSFNNGITMQPASSFVTNWSSSVIQKMLESTYITSIIANPYDSKEIWVSFGYFDKAGIGVYQTRVLHSTDAGETWTDFSEGLTCSTNGGIDQLPVNHLIFDELSGNNMIYAATEMGVYYRNDDISQWVRFSEGLPFCRVSRLVLDRNEKRLLAATWGRGVWYTDIPCCDNEPSTSTVQTNTVIENETVFSDIIVIPKGKVLTLKNTTFWFKPNTKIIVEPGDGTTYGGKLIIENALLTSYCSSFWGGIEVQGNWNQYNDNSFQGFVQITNSTIQYAYRGIYCGNELNGNLGGGIIISDNSTFKDCRVGIAFNPYPNYSPPLSYLSFSKIRQNKFLWTGALPDGSGKGMLNGISLHSINGVLLEGNDFINLAPENFNNNIVYSDGFRGNGILGIDASFLVDGYTYSQTDKCHQPVVKNNLFEGLTNGVVLLNSTNINARNAVLTSTFKNCQIGINALGDKFTKHYKNIFSWDGNFVNDDNNAYSISYFNALGIGQTDPYAVGIVHNGSDGFLTEGNQVNYEADIDRTKKHNAFAFNNVKGVTFDYSIGNQVINNTNYTNPNNEPFIIGKSALSDCSDLEFYCNEYCNLNTDWYWFNDNSNKISNQFVGSNNFSDPQSGRNVFNVNYYLQPPATGSKQVGFTVTTLYLPSNCQYPAPTIITSYNVTPSTISRVAPLNSTCPYTETNKCAIYKPNQVLPGDEYDGEVGEGGLMGVNSNQDLASNNFQKDSLLKLLTLKEYDDAIKFLKNIRLENNEDLDFKIYYQIMLNEFKNGNSLTEISSNGMSELKKLASNRTTYGAMAKILLLGVYGETIPQDFSQINDIKPHDNYTPEKYDLQNQFKIYPNPTSGSIIIDYNTSGEAPPITIEAFNILGEKLYLEQLKDTKGTHTLVTDSWSDGVYLINIKTQNKVLYTQKVVKLTH
ncbi:MAG: T9SS type A sorting domain-containing protein [Bacteroidota bacterium]